jgi:UDP-N-acetylglucosamine 2-epimerase
MTIVGTRPEIIKLSRVIGELEKYTEHLLVHTGQNFDYELKEIFFQQMELKEPDYYLNVAGNNVAESIGNIIARADEVLAREKPEALLLYGDTNSCLSVIPAKRRKIPVFHMEAGNRCFDQRVPEEINRKIVDHLSDINLPLTEHARRYLVQEGIRPETIIKIGSPMKEVLAYYCPRIEASKIMDRLKLQPGRFFLVSAHREENVDSREMLQDLLDTLETLAHEYNMPLIVSTHPRTRKRLEELGRRELDQRLHFLKPLGFLDYVKLQQESFCVISDSGTITEEASLLNFPAITIRQAHERPEGMDEGVLIMSGLKKERVLQSVAVVTAQHAAGEHCVKPVPDYDTGSVARKVVRIIISYIDYINRTVWFK